MEDNHLYLGLAIVSMLILLARRTLPTAAHRADCLKLPPGPWQLPIIGSLHHLVGQLPHRALCELARRHGPVMLLHFGEVPTLVVSSREAACEVMKTQDTTFATRPLSATIRVLSSDGQDIVFAPYGQYWCQVRKITVTELLTARRVISFRAIREEEVAAMLRVVSVAAGDGHTVDMRARLSAFVADTTVRAVMGDRCKYRAVMGDRCKYRDVFLRELDRIVELATGLNPVDLWPSSWLLGWLSNSVGRAQQCRDTVFGIIDGIIQEHLDRNGGESKDLLDVLLRLHKDGELSMVAVKAVILDIFNAGSETSGTTLEWAIAELIKNPKVMKKAAAEVRQAFETTGKVDEERLSDLPYLHLVIRETFRLHPPLPLLLPRECREQCQVLGYDIPKGTQVLVTAWALGQDQKYWPESPKEFRPERFEDCDSAAIDFRGADFELLPFGAGRRMCPGMAFGLVNVALPLASLLLHFDREEPGIADPAEFDMTEAFGITARRKASLLLRPVLRVPVPGVYSIRPASHMYAILMHITALSLHLLPN